MFLKINIGDILDEYWVFLVWGAVFTYLLIKKSTRKIAFKILCGIFLLVFTIAAVLLICIWLFGVDNGFITGWLILLNILFLYALWLSASELRRIIKLNKNGTHTYGTLVRRSYSSRSASVVAYRVDGKKYECRSHSPLRKYENGCDKVPVVYDAENPENSCAEKQDFAPAIALLSIYAVLEIGMTALTVYLCFNIFS